MRTLITAAVALLAIASAAWGQSDTAGAPLPITARQLSADELRAVGWGQPGSRLIYNYGFVLSSNDPGFAPFDEFNGSMATFRTRAGQIVTFDIGWGAGGRPIDLTNFRLAPQNARFLDGLQASRRDLAARDIPAVSGYRFVSAGPNGNNWIGAWRSVFRSAHLPTNRLLTPNSHFRTAVGRACSALQRQRLARIARRGLCVRPGRHRSGRQGHNRAAQCPRRSQGPSGTGAGPLLWEYPRPGQPPLSSCGPTAPTSAPAG